MGVKGSKDRTMLHASHKAKKKIDAGTISLHRNGRMKEDRTNFFSPTARSHQIASPVLVPPAASTWKHAKII